ncbi:hypothetical protein SK854_36420 [Lentzea sp. BCCO 10_0061]|uniref:Uncharacterized protein n=1 Tax=Lentzea sokolovensis TaxID=3095429 RepID=A0ABU4V7I1_9PSEU|nr:hypothetical protein [Lentzea sp. BCCO 10_0061]MDX8147644.1 hypothetical protein [Lentzea sp. BCCO 10_0061]
MSADSGSADAASPSDAPTADSAVDSGESAPESQPDQTHENNDDADRVLDSEEPVDGSTPYPDEERPEAESRDVPPHLEDEEQRKAQDGANAEDKREDKPEEEPEPAEDDQEPQELQDDTDQSISSTDTDGPQGAEPFDTPAADAGDWDAPGR